MSFKSLKTKITAQFELILVLTCGVIFAGIMMLRMIKGSMEKVEADTPEFVQSLELNKNMLFGNVSHGVLQGDRKQRRGGKSRRLFRRCSEKPYRPCRNEIQRPYY